MNAPDVVLEHGAHPLESPDDWWTKVLGSGYRGTIEQLDEESRELVRRDNLKFICESSIVAVEANVIYAVATKAQNRVCLTFPPDRASF